MKQFIHKSMALFMAAVVFTTTMSFTVDMHFCGETMIDFSFVQQAETCGMESDSDPIKVTSACENSTFTEKSCCTDTRVVKEGKDDLTISFDQLTFDQQVFIAVFTTSYVALFEGTETNHISFTDYPPPFLERDVQVLHQTFLI